MRNRHLGRLVPAAEYWNCNCLPALGVINEGLEHAERAGSWRHSIVQVFAQICALFDHDVRENQAAMVFHSSRRFDKPVVMDITATGQRIGYKTPVAEPNRKGSLMSMYA